MQPNLCRLAGFFAAHAIWCVSDGGPLVPMLAIQDAEEEPRMLRLAHERLEDAVQDGENRLDHPSPGEERAVLLYDGFIHLEDGKSDAILVDAREYGPSAEGFLLAVPYQPSDHPIGFAVHRPKFVEVSSPQPPDFQAMSDAFFEGVDSHERGAEVWNQHLDQSR